MDEENGRPPEIMRALLRNAQISPQKMRLTAAQVCGLTVQQALDLLDFSPKKAARILRKVLDSAVSNAEQNHAADVDELIVSMVRVDKGLALSRFEARARGRFGTRNKLRSNIEVRVGTELDPGYAKRKPRTGLLDEQPDEDELNDEYSDELEAATDEAAADEAETTSSEQPAGETSAAAGETSADEAEEASAEKPAEAAEATQVAESVEETEAKQGATPAEAPEAAPAEEPAGEAESEPAAKPADEPAAEPKNEEKS